MKSYFEPKSVFRAADNDGLRAVVDPSALNNTILSCQPGTTGTLGWEGDIQSLRKELKELESAKEALEQQRLNLMQTVRIWDIPTETVA